MLNKAYIIILELGQGLIWLLMILGKFAQYDNNYVYYSLALLVSLLITIFIIKVWWLDREIYDKYWFFTHLFLYTSSPISLYLFVTLYVEYIGQYFKS